QDLKLKYYQLLIELADQESNYLATCKHYKAIYETPIITEDKEKKHQALKHVVLFLVLAPFDNEQSDLLHRVKEDKTLEEIPLYKIDLSLNSFELEVCMQQTLCLKIADKKDIQTDNIRINTKRTQLSQSSQTIMTILIAPIANNIRVMAKYYTRISMTRMAQLLNLTVEESEHFLSELVVSKTVFARIDRPSGIVTFSSNKSPNEILNEWSHNLTTLMQLLNRTTHLITKEEMVHKMVQ
ncbi:predicted protein, partial [Nematostella vectensis]